MTGGIEASVWPGCHADAFSFVGKVPVIYSSQRLYFVSISCGDVIFMAYGESSMSAWRRKTSDSGVRQVLREQSLAKLSREEDVGFVDGGDVDRWVGESAEWFGKEFDRLADDIESLEADKAAGRVSESEYSEIDEQLGAEVEELHRRFDSVRESVSKLDEMYGDSDYVAVLDDVMASPEDVVEEELAEGTSYEDELESEVDREAPEEVPVSEPLPEGEYEDDGLLGRSLRRGKGYAAGLYRA